MKNITLHWQILIALVLATIVGSVLNIESSVVGIKFLSIFAFGGTIFLNLLKMVIVPLIIAAMIVSVIKIAGHKDFALLGKRGALYYVLTSFIAVVIGLFFVNLLTPGVGQVLFNQEASVIISNKLGDKDLGSIVEIFIRMIPTNIFQASSESNILALIFFSVIFGFFASKLPEKNKITITHFFEGVFETMMMITQWVLKFAPIGVFCLVSGVVVKTGVAQFEQVLWFFITVILALTTHFLIVMPLILKFFSNTTFIKHLKDVAPALLTAFSTSSSASTLPVTMECIENAGVDKSVSRLILPLGATINMDGTALYECIAVIFIAQLAGVDLSLSQQLLVVILALTTSIGVAGIPSASLVAIGLILTALGLPLEAMAILLVTDRILDMLRTSVNVFGDTCGARVLDKVLKKNG
ncbi:Proton/glutamate symport protein @ Sodium/glutamate symport protein [hydrothermal vent metagenome]|uniref:Proton/glutamate symport protein @ Sodium/glutamate symport protein n=1 Tax=hydrothermal vent metagenome TaxID=652676 RepID=A0A1W1CFV1_9ZZZZ